MRSAEQETDVCLLGLLRAGSHGAWHVGSRHLSVSLSHHPSDIILKAEMPMSAVQPDLIYTEDFELLRTACE